MSNNMNNNFSASLNGKVYTNRKEFLNAIRATKNNQIKDIRISESVENNQGPTSEKKTVSQPVTLAQPGDITPLLALLGITPAQFDAIAKSIAQRMTAATPGTPLVREPDAVEITRANLQKKFDEQMAYLTDQFLFLNYDKVNFKNPDRENEYFLDQTSKKMYALLQEFKNTVVRYSPKVLVEFRKLVEREQSCVQRYYTVNLGTLKELQTNISNLKHLGSMANQYGYKLVSAETGEKDIINRIKTLSSAEKENMKRVELGELLRGYYNQLLAYFNA